VSGNLRSADLAPTTYSAAITAERLQVMAGRHPAVKDLNLSFGTGVHGLLGPNGAGKTTLMRALGTVVRPSAGRLMLLGEDSTDIRRLPAIRRKLGYMPQHIGFYPRFTVAEFVSHLAWLKEVPENNIPAATERAIDRVGLADRAGSKMRTLSGGMIRRAGIAQAIVNDPEILLLDEPTAGLDPEQRLSFRALLRELGTDTCVLVSTHLVEDVAAACTDVLLMAEGKQVFAGELAELLATDPGEGALDGSAAERAYTWQLTRHRGQQGTGW
jgi:ABC-2 type transport system ATP-binding protein